MQTSDLRGRWVLVTGAGSGIGRATALLAAERGAGLVLGDVDEARLGQVTAECRERKVEVIAERVDVANAAQMERFAAAVHARIEAVDILVNNAGVALTAGLLDTTLEDWDWILGINVKGVVHGCHFFCPRMRARGKGGHVVNLASIAGFLAVEPMAAYSTTKFAVVGLSEALRAELAPFGIGVTAICPGIIRTAITTDVRARGRFAGAAAKTIDQTFTMRGYPPERVAKAIFQAIAKNRAIAPVTPEAWSLYFLKRFAPGLTAHVLRMISRRFDRVAAGGGDRSP